ncbi:MAG: rhodanese-like domain-containing protein [Verrucomicrobiota bacterium]
MKRKLTSMPGQLALILVLSVLAAVVTGFVHPKRPPWYRVASAEELRWRIDTVQARELIQNEDVLLIDAREREKFEASHLPGAVLLNLAEWSDLMFENMETLQDSFERSVVVYCDTDTCGKSQEIAKRLRELIGLDPVYVLFGDWRELKDTVQP